MWLGGPLLKGPFLQVVVKRLRRISDSPTNPNAEGNDELDGEEAEVVPNSIGHQSSTSTSQPVSKRFQIQVIPSNPRNFQSVLCIISSSIPPPSPNPSTARGSLASTMRPSPIPQPELLQWSPPKNYHLWPAPVEEEKVAFLFHFLPPKCFSKSKVGLSSLPEKIQIWKMKARMLWPGFKELTETLGR
ncbi:hypothetical protein O181_057536 [Austropuccinia psidii MF-1]|uniref:Uncharacterized protein n=1 Tax=Austropuccinia psidii MF-1 TaxID=1389203 RepID=A0A9Q3EFD1_9BASI|nr:hypothetical protein [Austropuccinia psidii MF-1]